MSSARESLRSSFSQPESSPHDQRGTEQPQRAPSARHKSLRMKLRRSNELADDMEAKQNLLKNIPEVARNYDVVSKIGEGTFSSVFLAQLRGVSEFKLAIKHLVPTSSSVRVENEIYCLQKMGGQDHVISLLAYVRHEDHVALVMPYFPHDKLVDCLPSMGVGEMRCYMRGLFEALRKIHSLGIIHRDIKPSNFLYNRQTLSFQLVDFGLAHLESQTKGDRGSILKAFQAKQTVRQSSNYKTATNHFNPSATKISNTTYRRQTSHAISRSRQVPRKRPKISVAPLTSQPPPQGVVGDGRDTIRICPTKHKVNYVCDRCMKRSNQIAPRAGTPGFRAPEVLLKYPHQTTAVDIWSAGVILLCLLSGRYPFFRAHDDMTAMAQIVGLFGSAECVKAARSYGKTMICDPEVEPYDIKELCTSLRAAVMRCASHDLRHNSASDALREYEVVGQNGCGQAEDEPSPSKRRKLRSRTKSLDPLPPHDDGAGPQADTDSDSWNQVPESAYELMKGCLDLNPFTRLTAEQALEHEFFHKL